MVTHPIDPCFTESAAVVFFSPIRAGKGKHEFLSPNDLKQFTRAISPPHSTLFLLLVFFKKSNMHMFLCTVLKLVRHSHSMCAFIDWLKF